jgi:uncharacterized protein YbjT (DUF2867 family)
MRMHVLVTGGTGVIGKPAVDALLREGHTVRLFTRNADRDHRLWREGVEPRSGSVASDEDVRGAATGCDAILHIAGIVDEHGPHATFENVNVEGTRRIVEEAERAGVRRLVCVSSLGADRGSSGYHRSKLDAERIAARFGGDWLVIRPGNVYGPGDEVISLLLRMVRTLPAIPVIGGDQHFQPVRADDLGRALARAFAADAPARTTLEVAGSEQVTMNEMLDLLEEIIGRSPARVPVPGTIARAAASLADTVGLDVPVNADQITMLLEENVIRPPQRNALLSTFGVQPTPLREGLEILADSLPAQLPSEGVGELRRQRYWADIRGSRLDANALFDLVRRDFFSLVPDEFVEVGAEPGTPASLEEGATMTMAIPLRGHIQVRVAEVSDLAATCVTLEGHNLAGVIRFAVIPLGDRLRFEIRSYTRAAGIIDNIGMAAGGARAQKATWTSTVEEVVERSGGTTDEVHDEAVSLPDREAARVERWVEQIVMRRERETERARPRE